MITKLVHHRALSCIERLMPRSSDPSAEPKNFEPEQKLTGDKKQALAFERDYPTFLLSLASSVRAGLDPLAAMLTTREVFPESSPVHQEIARVESLIRSGEPELEALERFAENVAHPDLPLFRATLSIAMREGGPIGPSLERLARVTRRRQAFRQRARGAVAMQRLSAFGIVASALSIIIFQLFTAREQVVQAATHPFGGVAYLLGGTFLISGITWLLMLTRSRI
jgi:Flp pilus assembly protein TadB